MSRYRYDQQTYDAAGFDWPRAVVLLGGIVLAAPALLLGLVGLFVWRRFGLSRRDALVTFAAALMPTAAALYAWHVNPLTLFLKIQLSLVMALVLKAVGQGSAVPPEFTPLVYAVAIAPAVLPLSCVVAFVGAWLTRPRKSQLQTREATSVQVPRHVEKRAAGGVQHPPDGWALGYRPDGHPVVVTDAEARMHVVVCGSTGAGKTTAIRHVLDGVAHRCPVVLVDCKASPTLRRAVEAIPGALVWSIGDDLRWDALRGDPTCFASKMLAAEQFGPNAAIYRAAAERYLQWVGRVLEWTHTPRDPAAVAELLSPKVLAMRLRELRNDAPPEWWERHGEPLARRLGDMGEAEDEGVRGFASRFGSVVEGTAGEGLGAGAGALVLEDAVREGRVVLFSLDAAAYPTVAAKIGAWVLLDLVRVAGLLQDDGWAEDQQLYVVVDEFSALREEGRHVVPLLARAREAGVAVILATQGLADLERVDRSLPQQVVQNTAVRVLLRQHAAEDALAWAKHLGELEREELSRKIEPAGWFGGERDTGEWSTRWRRDFHVRPEELQALGTGEAIVAVAPVVERKRRLERVRIAQPRGYTGAPAPDGRGMRFGPVRVRQRA